MGSFALTGKTVVERDVGFLPLAPRSVYLNSVLHTREARVREGWIFCFAQ